MMSPTAGVGAEPVCGRMKPACAACGQQDAGRGLPGETPSADGSIELAGPPAPRVRRIRAPRALRLYCAGRCSDAPCPPPRPSRSPSSSSVARSAQPSRSRVLAAAAETALRGLGVAAGLVDLRDVDLPLCDGGACYDHPAVCAAGAPDRRGRRRARGVARLQLRRERRREEPGGADRRGLEREAGRLSVHGGAAAAATWRRSSGRQR